jgi:peroxiredoxin
MIKLAMVIALICPLAVSAQQHYIVKGDVGTIISPSKVFLIYTDGKQSHIISSPVKNGEFYFEGNVSDTTLASLMLNYKGDDVNEYNSKPIYLVNGQTTLTGKTLLINAKVTGNDLNEDLYRYNLMIYPVNKNSPSDVNKKILAKNFITQNPNSYISLVCAFKRVASGYVNVDEIEPVFNWLSLKVRSTKAGVAYQKYIKTLLSIKIGALAPEFTQPDVKGNLISLSSFRGKYVLLDFWASWCSPCRYENPNVVKAYKKYNSKNFTILSVSLDAPATKNAWVSAINNGGLTWNQVSDLKGWKNGAAQLYGIRAIPQNFLIDPDGKIIARNIMGDQLENKLSKVLGN